MSNLDMNHFWNKFYDILYGCWIIYILFQDDIVFIFYLMLFLQDNSIRRTGILNMTGLSGKVKSFIFTEIYW